MGTDDNIDKLYFRDTDRTVTQDRRPLSVGRAAALARGRTASKVRDQTSLSLAHTAQGPARSRRMVDMSGTGDGIDLGIAGARAGAITNIAPTAKLEYVTHTAQRESESEVLRTHERLDRLPRR